jgi:hypothetical protein
MEEEAFRGLYLETAWKSVYSLPKRIRCRRVPLIMQDVLRAIELQFRLVCLI